MTAKLSEPQRRLLAEVSEAGTLYVRRYSVWFRTIDALHRRGLVAESEPDYSRLQMSGYTITEAGQARLP